ncbi:hypothetical protein DAEQUDRAFT_161409 [Daedalea quercina L-15889]|uniref:ARID domain-containing protein n=1 Tax=Daedalea quercina L-15889 TaxID=1314783 RepID=A0A165KKM4_9APHY|nr:hypothetical protein DAEQUDRAFT_161409 [Daedalea quercina L-15889]
MNDSGVRIRVSREDFARAFSLHRRAEGRPVVERVSLSEGNPIELYSLFAEVMCVEGFLVVSRRRLWKSTQHRAHWPPSLKESMIYIFWISSARSLTQPPVILWPTGRRVLSPISL